MTITGEVRSSMAPLSEMPDRKTRLEAFLQEPLANVKEFKTIANRPIGEVLSTLASQLKSRKFATHIVKGVHPQASGTNILFSGDSSREVVGTHSLPSLFPLDTVGNAKMLPVDKFLRLVFEGETLIDLLQRGDPDLLSFFGSAPYELTDFLKVLKEALSPESQLQSHYLAKQVYWLAEGDDNPLDDSAYHLLSPLFPSSLVDWVRDRIREDQSGDSSRAVRDAKRKGLYCDGEVHTYPNLAIVAVGGANPQNVSGLFSRNTGKTYLLTSLPPIWNVGWKSLPLGVPNFFAHFGRLPNVRRLLEDFSKFLDSDPRANVFTRRKRDRFFTQLIELLHLEVLTISSLDPGWTSDERCLLHQSERLWLDPGRAERDGAFALERINDEWKDNVLHRFSSWLNQILRMHTSLAFGDVEYDFWKASLDDFPWLEWILPDGTDVTTATEVQ